MYLHRDDIQKIKEVISKFPDVETFELLQDTSSGIGSHTTMIVHTSVEGIDGKFEVVISSVDNW